MFVCVYVPSCSTRFEKQNRRNRSLTIKCWKRNWAEMRRKCEEVDLCEFILKLADLLERDRRRLGHYRMIQA